VQGSVKRLEDPATETRVLELSGNRTGVQPSPRPLRLSGLGLDSVTEAAYYLLLEHPTWTPDQLTARLELDGSVANGVVNRLKEVDLVRTSEAGSPLRPVSPALGLTALAARREAELAEGRHALEQGRLAIADLISGLDEVQPPQRAGRGVDICWGARNIRARIAHLAGAATSEVLAMSTSTMLRPDESVIPAPSTIKVACRLVFADRQDNATRSVQLRALAASDIQVRLGRVPLSALIVDGVAVAFPVSDATAGQAVGVATVWLPSAVVALAELFERVWADAAPADRQPAGDNAAPAQRERDLLALLVAGVTDESAAYRLGISVRTVRRMVSDLMDRLGARSRFQAGARAAERGWLRSTASGN
jgi:DNA-binding CsgD family transcriptional regulator